MNSKHLNLKLAIQMAAPHTWAASLVPTIVSGALCYKLTGKTPDFMVFICLILIGVLMQSSANIINDYYDKIRGADTKDDYVDENDSVLVYNDINPKEAKYLGLACIALSFVLAIYPLIKGGPLLLVIGGVGALVIVLYSAGPRPISYLPLGELVSGTVMGILLPVACYVALTSIWDARVIVFSIPMAIGIGLIMMTNNTCDIEKDKKSGRRTLPSILGRNVSVIIYKILLVLWIIYLGIVGERLFINRMYFNYVFISLAILLSLASILFFVKQIRLNLQPFCRPYAMKGIARLNLFLGLTYACFLCI